MDGSVIQTWMSDVLHGITQGLLVPDIVMLILFIGYALFCIGSIIVEYFTERKHFKVAMPKFLAALMAAEEDGIPSVIEESGLLKRQKIALLTVYDYRMLPGDALVALIRRLVNEEESRYSRISGRNNMAARVSPMLGLMGTLIPLGPGIQALGKANPELLSASLLIAFDTTVAGLVVAAICMVIGKIRSIWYGNYMSALDSAMATMLQKIEDMRAEGKIVEQEPSDYAFLFEQAHVKSGKGGGADEAAQATDEKKDGLAKAGEPAAQPPAQQVLGEPGLPLATAVPDAHSAQAQDAMNWQAGPQAELEGQGAPMSGLQGLSPLNGLAQAEVAPVASSDDFQPLRDQAAFAPVPDPAFISDLAAAAANSFEPQPQVQAFEAPAATSCPYEPAPAVTLESAQTQAQQPAVAAGVSPEALPSIELGSDASVLPAQQRQTGGWYQPRLRTDGDASGLYVPPIAYPSVQATQDGVSSGSPDGTTGQL